MNLLFRGEIIKKKRYFQKESNESFFNAILSLFPNIQMEIAI